jgi:site-specific DNA-methyltransferase (adenine-specific)
MIYASADKGSTVCDPFVGSGSSAIAAIKNACNFIGCDTSRKAIDISQQRVFKFVNTGIDILQSKSAALKGEKIFWE